MSIKEKRAQLRWEWMQSIGKTSFVWRYILVGSVYFGFFLYPWQAGINLLLGGHGVDPHELVWLHFINYLLLGGLAGWIGSLWEWSRCERRHQVASVSTAAA